MADIIQTNVKAGGVVEMTTLDELDRFYFQKGARQVLVLINSTGSATTPKLTGSLAPSALKVRGLVDLDLTGGYQVGEIPSDGLPYGIPLEPLYEWLRGTAFIADADGLKAYIMVEGAAPTFPVELTFIQGGRLVASGKLTVDSRLWS